MQSVNLKVDPKEYEKVRCISCDTVGKWKNVDEFRYKPSQMHMCEHCGFVTYPDVTLNQEKLKEHYKQDYRPAPGSNNVHSSGRKLHYHNAFLEPLFDEWNKKQKANPKILEIGAALGIFLAWARNKYPKGEVYGTELTRSFVRNAFWTRKIKLDPDADWTKKYDLIMTYKVAEHQPDIDVQLEKYREALTKDGKLYISVPTWFGCMSNFGADGFSLEYYYDKNHVNVWSRNLFERLLKKKGFKIIQENHSMYDDTYLCVVAPEGEGATLPPFDSPAERLVQLEKILKASKLFDTGKFGEAIEAWSNFPVAHINFYEMNRSKAHQAGFEEIDKNHIQIALKCCPDNPAVVMFAGDLCMRYNRWDDAIAYFDKVLAMRPYEANALLSIANCLRAQSASVVDNKALRAKLRHNAMGLVRIVEQNHSQGKDQAIDWIMADAAEIPTPFEPGCEGMFEIDKGPAEQPN